MLLLTFLLVSITPNSELIINAGKDWQAKSIQSGKMNNVLQKYAEQHADRMARAGRGGHHNWETRFHELERALPEYTGFQEVAAESWPWQNANQSASEMFNCWRQSSHWKVVNSKCSIWGYSMAKGRNGIHYGCGIIAHRKKR